MKVLSSLPPQDDPRLLVGSSHFDDAGVLAVDDELAIVQSTDFMLIASEYVGATRSVYMSEVEPPPIDTFMGHSVAHWDGDTLVIESDTFNDLTWFDRAGNFHSEALRVVERITPTLFVLRVPKR